MKHFVYVLLLITHQGFSQSISFSGLVYEHNSLTKTGKLNPISDAQVIIPYATPVVTDNEGKYNTESDRYQKGQSVKIDIRKKGFEIVNRNETQNYITGTIDDLKIFVANSEDLYHSQLKYYNIAKQNIELTYTQKIEKLTLDFNELRKAVSSGSHDVNAIERLKAKRNALEKERETALNSANNLARTIAEINLDFVSNLYRTAIQLYKTGHVDSCLKILESAEFEQQQIESLKEINRLKDEMGNQTGVLKTILDRDMLRAQIHLSRLQIDSVNSITGRAVQLCFTNFQAIGSNGVLNLFKQAISMDPGQQFDWHNIEIYDDLRSIVRLNGGKESVDEAEVLRLQGVYSSSIGEAEEAFDLLKQSLKLHEKIKSEDSALVLLNLLDNAIVNNYNGIEYFGPLTDMKNPLNAGNLLWDNPYWLSTLVKSPEHIRYGYLTVNKLFVAHNLMSQQLQLVDNALFYCTRKQYKRDYSEDFINFLKIQMLKIRSSGQQLSKYDLDVCKTIESSTNKNSMAYWDILKIVKDVLIHSRYHNLCEPHVDTSISKYSRKILDDITKNESINLLNSEYRIEAEITKLAFQILAFKYDTYDSNRKDHPIIISSWTNFLGTWINSLKNQEHIGIYYNNYDVICKLFILSERDLRLALKKGGTAIREIMLAFAKQSAPKQAYGGETIYKDLLLVLNRENYFSDSEEYLNALNDVLEYNLQVPEHLSSRDSAFGLIYGLSTPPLEDDLESSAPILNNVSSFFYGSDWAMKIGTTGTIESAKAWSPNQDQKINYDSLWQSYCNHLVLGDKNAVNEDFEKLYDSSWWQYTKEPKSKSKIEDVKLMRADALNTVRLIPPSLSLDIYYFKGNQALINLDRIYLYLMMEYDSRAEYANNTRQLAEFIEYGLPDFFRGYSTVTSNSTVLAHVFFYGIKASVITNDKENTELFTNKFQQLVGKLGKEERIDILNDFLQLTSENSSYLDYSGKNVSLNFDIDLINKLYKEFDSAIQEYSLTREKEKNSVSDLEVITNKTLKRYYLTISAMSHIVSFNPDIFDKLKDYYPNESLILRNEALYYLRIGEMKNGLETLKKAIDMGFRNDIFFLEKPELAKYHKRINKSFESTIGFGGSVRLKDVLADKASYSDKYILLNVYFKKICRDSRSHSEFYLSIEAANQYDDLFDFEKNNKETVELRFNRHKFKDLTALDNLKEGDPFTVIAFLDSEQSYSLSASVDYFELGTKYFEKLDYPQSLIREEKNGLIELNELGEKLYQCLNEQTDFSKAFLQCFNNIPYDTILTMFKNDAGMLNNVAWVISNSSENKSDLMSALNMVKRATFIQFETDHNTLDTYAFVLNKLGNLDESKVVLRKAMQLANKIGDVEAAKKYEERLLTK